MKIAIRILISIVSALLLFLIINTIANSAIGGLASSSGWPIKYSYHCLGIPGYEEMCQRNFFSLVYLIIDYLIFLIPAYLLTNLLAKKSKKF